MLADFAPIGAGMVLLSPAVVAEGRLGK